MVLEDGRGWVGLQTLGGERCKEERCGDEGDCMYKVRGLITRHVRQEKGAVK